MRRIALATRLGAVLVLAAGGLAAAAPAAPPGTGRAWIDDPLSGSAVAVGTPVTVLAHAADQHGVDEVRLDVNGDTAQKIATAGARLVAATFAWTPPGGGVFTLAVRGRSAGDTWGSPGSTVVVVITGSATGVPGLVPEPDPGDAPPPTTDTTTPAVIGPIPPAAPTPPASTTAPTTTTSPCRAGAPTPTSPGDYALVDANPVTLQWSYGDSCPAQSFRAVLLDPDGATVGTAEVGGTQWTTPVLTTCIPYSWKVAAIHDGDQGPFSATSNFVIRGRACGG